MPEHAKLLDVVISLDPLSNKGVVRGQVGTVVEQLDGGRVLVEFSNVKGKELAVLPVKRSRLFVLHETETAGSEC